VSSPAPKASGSPKGMGGSGGFGEHSDMAFPSHLRLFVAIRPF
jgi:hypothetical protein